MSGALKVQLVFAPPERPPVLGEFGEQINPPLGILSLAAYLRRHCSGVRLSVVDGLRQGYERTWQAVADFGADVVGISYYTPTAASALRLATRIKELRPGALVLLGGAHATAVPEEGLARSLADAVVYGEGEETLRCIVDRLLAGTLPESLPWRDIDGVYYRTSQGIAHTKPRQFIADLDQLPFPARDLIDLRDYDGYYLYKSRPQTFVLWSRGCLADCTFCSKRVWETSSPRIRVRSPRNIADEIEHLRRDFGIREVYDNGDEFNNDMVNAKAVCREFIARKLDVDWMTLLRAHPFDRELASLMADSGCWCAGLGIESGNPEAVRGIHKGITLDQAEGACELLKQHGIKVHAFFMLFNVWEERGELRFEDEAMTRRTLDYARRLADQRLVDYIGWSITTPFPGSRLYDIAVRHRLIPEQLLTDWDAWLKDTSFLMNLPGVSHQQMAGLKAEGSMLRGRLMLRSGGIGFKDIGYYLKKSMKIVQNIARSRRTHG